MREIAVAFGGTKVSVSDDGVSILSDDATIEEVEAALKGMPCKMIFEIREAVGDACLGWGSVKKRTKSPTL